MDIFMIASLRQSLISRNGVICLWLTACSLFAQGPNGGNLAGSVSDESGKPVAGAFVTALRNTVPPASGRTTSDAKGAFAISDLPAGTYSVCVQVPGGGFLDPCEWSLSSPTADVKQGQSTAGVQLKLRSGAIVQVRLNDLGKLLETASAAGNVPEVLLAVRTPKGLPHPARLVSKDATGRNLAVTVPFDTALKFTVFSSRATLTNATGTSIAPAGTDVPFIQPSGAPPLTLTFHVTGQR